MGAQIDINLTAIIVSIGGFLVSVICWLVANSSTVKDKRYDQLCKKIDDIAAEIKDLPAIREAIDWFKRKNKK